MKTPEEIKKGHECCASGSCLGCPYKTVDHCVTKKNNDVKAYINTLECMVLQEQAKTHLTFLENENLKSRISQTEQERDAAVNDLKLVRCCGTCVNNEGGCTTECYIVSGVPTGWQWRGVCAENTKEARNESSPNS